MSKFIVRITACWYILTRKYDHWFTINIDEKNLQLLLEEQDFETTITYHGLQPYNIKEIMRTIMINRTEEDRILEKAAFQAESQLLQQKKKNEKK